ncbi:hypothetical protein RSOL_114800, partial [Rhizoctonia solani AG-3 Rhs1AP]
MLNELTAASEILLVALDRYSVACSVIQNSYTRGYKPQKVDPQLLPRLDAEIDFATSLELKLARAKAALNWSRNYSHTRATVNDIPPEHCAKHPDFMDAYRYFYVDIP